jgi:hypothetical protein
MSMHSDWKTAKTTAKAKNNNREVKFAGSANLGGALDTFEAKHKAWDKLRGDGTPAEAKAKADLKAAAKAVTTILVNYRAQLKTMSTPTPAVPVPPVSHTAAQFLDNHIVFQIMNPMNHMLS